MTTIQSPRSERLYNVFTLFKTPDFSEIKREPCKGDSLPLPASIEDIYSGLREAEEAQSLGFALRDLETVMCELRDLYDAVCPYVKAHREVYCRVLDLKYSGKEVMNKQEFCKFITDCALEIENQHHAHLERERIGELADFQEDMNNNPTMFLSVAFDWFRPEGVQAWNG